MEANSCQDERHRWLTLKTQSLIFADIVEIFGVVVAESHLQHILCDILWYCTYYWGFDQNDHNSVISQQKMTYV